MDIAVMNHMGRFNPYQFLPQQQQEYNEYDQDKYSLFVIGNRTSSCLITDDLQEEYNIIYAPDGLYALQMLNNIELPDVIISDMDLGIMSGIDFFKSLLKERKHHHIPFIFIAGERDDNIRLKALRMGAIDYITAPFNTDEVIAKISSVIDIMVSKQLNIFENLQDYNKRRINDICQSHRVTQAEKRTIEYLLEGADNKQIASHLNVKLGTVKCYLSSVYKKFNVHTRLELTNILKL